MKTLVIVESPNKIKTIQKYLGNDYIIKASCGHVRELSSENMGIDVANNFQPTYVISKGKHKYINSIKEGMKYCQRILLATDEDREGEAIAWHLVQVLNLKNSQRMVFHEITKKALEHSLKNLRSLDLNLVQAQQARSVLDKLVGFEISPTLWKHISSQTQTSAGRVQSVAVKLVVDRENEINNFQSQLYFKTHGIFDNKLEGDLDKNFDQKEDTLAFLKACQTATFLIADIQKKKVKRYPSAPFETSTLQQEGGRKLGLTSKQVMSTAQSLYEKGYITYHRTDCTILSQDVLGKIKAYILEKYNDKYLNLRQYKTKSKNAQEAHEAIRPTEIKRIDLADDSEIAPIQQKLYQLIWKRAVASQMAPCEVEVFTVKISISNRPEIFICKAEKIIFPGFKVVYDYQEDTDKDEEKPSETKNKQMLKIIDNLQLAQVVKYQKITSSEKYTTPIARYSEPNLVKKMKTLGIGRPSTWASIMEKIKDRKYVEKRNEKGRTIDICILTLENDKISESKGKTTLQAEKNKLFPTDLGKTVNNFLVKNFDNIMNYKYTSQVEDELDHIAKGQKVWYQVVKDFYQDYHPAVEKLNDNNSTESMESKKDQKRLVGNEITTGKNIYAYLGRYGPVLQIGDKKDDIRFVSIKSDQSIDTISEHEANQLLIYPKNLGQHNGHSIFLKDGKFGLYLEYNGKNYKLKNDFDQNLSLEDAISCLEETSSKIIKTLNQTTKIMNGPYGPYIIFGKKFVSIPSEMDPEKLTLQDCKEIMNQKSSPKKTKPKTKKK